MVVVDRQYKGAASQATLLTSMTATTPGGGGTITVDDASGYPASGKFEITIDREGQGGSQEHVLISSRSGTTFTISSRGYDDSVATSHTSGTSKVELWLSARTVQLFTDHVDDVEADPHSTKLLNNTRHDITARHTFGAALGTPGTPITLTPDIPGNAGSSSVPARSDHQHNVPAASASAISGANAEGSSGNFARADHDHALAAGLYGTGTTTIDPDDATSHGVSTALSRTDHQHQATAAAPATIVRATSNTEGVAASFARSDHGHQITGLSAWYSGGRWTRNTTQNITSGADTYITWNNEITDDDGWLGTPSDTLTVPFAGRVHISANVRWEANTTGSREIRIHHTPFGGSLTNIAEQSNDAISAIVTRQSVSGGWVAVSAGDTFKIEVTQGSGSTLTVGSATASAADTNVSVMLLRT